MRTVSQTRHASQPPGRVYARYWAGFLELLGSMRFAISLLTLVCIASVIGTVVVQAQPWVNYVNQFGPFWAGLFQALGVFHIYNSAWFVGIMAFLVASTSLCVWRNAPKMVREMRVFKEKTRESSLRAFPYRWEGTFKESADQLPQTIKQWLAYRGYRVRLDERSNGTLVAAKAGSANRFGYIAAHVSIVVVCIGGLFDSGIPTQFAIWAFDKKPVQGGLSSNSIPPSARLGVGHFSYRASLLLPEGASSRVAVLRTDSGVLVQDLPFEMRLDRFWVDYYSTGMPKRFASDVTVRDPETGSVFEATIEVNKPLVYKGVTVYQSSFDDGGTRVELSSFPLSGAAVDPFEVDLAVGESVELSAWADGKTLEVTGFKSINVESIDPTGGDSIGNALGGDDEKLSAFAKNLAAITGPGVKEGANDHFTNVGPSVTYKLRDASGQALEYKNYMLPINFDGGRYVLSGVRETPEQEFRYLRIPVDEGGQVNGFIRLRQALASAELRKQAAIRFAQNSLGGSSDGAGLTESLADSANRALDTFAGLQGVNMGFSAVADFIDESVPEAEKQQATQVIVRIIQGGMWELLQLSRIEAGLPPADLDEQSARFLQDAQLAMSDLDLYRVPFLLQLESFDEVKASVFQIAKAPGQSLVYLGCLFLVLGVFSMFYIRQRRVFFWVSTEGHGSRVLMGMSTTRKSLDFEEEYKAMIAELNSRSVHADAMNKQE